MRKIVLLLAIAVCTEWATGNFMFEAIRKCEDSTQTCYQTSGGYGVAMSCQSRTEPKL